MKAIKITALFLWIFIFVVLAFLAGQYLCQKEMFNIFGKDKEVDISKKTAEDVIKDKDIKINKQFAENYFGGICEGFVRYLLTEEKNIPEEKSQITEEYISEYIFYAISNGMETTEYELHETQKDTIYITESEVNSFVDKKFGVALSKTVVTDDAYGYNSEEKTYKLGAPKNNKKNTIIFSATNIENIDDAIAVTFKDNEEKIFVYLKYNNGNYIMTSIEKK